MGTKAFLVPDSAPPSLISSAPADTEGEWEGVKGRIEDDSSAPLLAELSRDDDLDAPPLDCRPSPATQHSLQSHNVANSLTRSTSGPMCHCPDAVIIPHHTLQPTNIKKLETFHHHQKLNQKFNTQSIQAIITKTLASPNQKHHTNTYITSRTENDTWSVGSYIIIPVQ
jgi:hypothetical protein